MLTIFLFQIVFTYFVYISSVFFESVFLKLIVEINYKYYITRGEVEVRHIFYLWIGIGTEGRNRINGVYKFPG
jgi:hypothetical protein